MGEVRPRRRTTVRELIKTDPVARRRLGRAYVWLLGWFLSATGVVGSLLIWLLVRRSRRVREGLGRPRPIRWPLPEDRRDVTP